MSPKDIRQPPCRVRLRRAEDRVDVLGAVGLSCRLTCWVETATNSPVPIQFRVDSGASYSFMSLSEAQLRGLDTRLTQPEVELPLTTAAGPTMMRMRPGRIRCRWNRAPQGHPFDWPVLFRVNQTSWVPPVLGLGSIFQTCRWTFDGGLSADFPYGSLTLHDIR